MVGIADLTEFDCATGVTNVSHLLVMRVQANQKDSDTEKKKKKSLPPSKGKKGFIQTRVTYLRTPLEQEKKQLNKT